MGSKLSVAASTPSKCAASWVARLLAVYKSGAGGGLLPRAFAVFRRDDKAHRLQFADFAIIFAEDASALGEARQAVAMVGIAAPGPRAGRAPGKGGCSPSRSSAGWPAPMSPRLSPIAIWAIRHCRAACSARTRQIAAPPKTPPRAGQRCLEHRPSPVGAGQGDGGGGEFCPCRKCAKISLDQVKWDAGCRHGRLATVTRQGSTGQRRQKQGSPAAQKYADFRIADGEAQAFAHVLRRDVNDVAAARWGAMDGNV